MSEIFSDVIMQLPEADINLEGLKANLAQGESWQVLFMNFEKDAVIAEHEHAEQWGIVLEGKIDLLINGEKHIYTKGDRYFIPAGVKHSVNIYAGYADITFFNSNRYSIKS